MQFSDSYFIEKKIKTFCLRCIKYFRQIAIANRTTLSIPLLCSLFIYSQTISATTEHTTQSDSNRWDALMNWNFMAIPYMSYTPETSWQFGTTGVYYFKTPKSPLYSDFNFNLGYSLDTQWHIDLNSRIHFNSPLRWYLDSYLSAKNSNDIFFGIANTQNSSGYAYHTNLIDIQAKPSFYISNRWIITPTLRIHYEDAFLKNTDSYSIPNNSVAGFGKNCFIGIGAAITYDSRNNFYYPTKGLFAKINTTYNQPLISNCSNSAIITSDIRQFIPIYNNLIFAWNLYTEFSLGDDIPFQLMPTIGGQDMLRGIRRNLYKNDYIYTLQGELRIPIWKFLKATVFAAIGDAYNYNQTNWSVPKVGYGAGLRACIHQSKTNIRLDIARQNYDNNWSVYFTVKEAF